MPFQILALPYEPFAELFTSSETALAAANIVKVVADTSPGFPCRVSLADAQVGETVLLLNHAHVTGATPYAAAHAIYVREGAVRAQVPVGVVPDVLARRLLSVRGFNAHQMMVEADVVEGRDLAQTLDAFFTDPAIACVHIHNAKQGCFAAKAVRA